MPAGMVLAVVWRRTSTRMALQAQGPRTSTSSRSSTASPSTSPINKVLPRCVACGFAAACGLCHAVAFLQCVLLTRECALSKAPTLLPTPSPPSYPPPPAQGEGARGQGEGRAPRQRDCCQGLRDYARQEQSQACGSMGLTHSSRCPIAYLSRTAATRFAPKSAHPQKSIVTTPCSLLSKQCLPRCSLHGLRAQVRRPRLRRRPKR